MHTVSLSITLDVSKITSEKLNKAKGITMHGRILDAQTTYVLYKVLGKLIMGRPNISHMNY